MSDVRSVLGLPPVDPAILERFGPPTYTEAQVIAYATSRQAVEGEAEPVAWRPDREDVARLLSPEAFVKVGDGRWVYPDQVRASALSMADAILALPPASVEAKEVETNLPPAKDAGEWVTSSRAVDAAVQELHRRRLSLVWADTQTVFDVVRSVLAEVKKAAPPSPEGARADLMTALDGFADDYMTSEAHHPGYVLIPTAKFETIRAALSVEGK